MTFSGSVAAASSLAEKNRRPPRVVPVPGSTSWISRQKVKLSDRIVEVAVM